MSMGTTKGQGKGKGSLNDRECNETDHFVIQANSNTIKAHIKSQLRTSANQALAEKYSYPQVYEV